LLHPFAIVRLFTCGLSLSSTTGLSYSIIFFAVFSPPIIVAVLEKFTNKGQDRNKIVTDDNHNALHRKADSILFCSNKKDEHGKVEKENHAVTDINDQGVIIWQ
jgi:hypothetical protein